MVEGFVPKTLAKESAESPICGLAAGVTTRVLLPAAHETPVMSQKSREDRRWKSHDGWTQDERDYPTPRLPSVKKPAWAFHLMAKRSIQPRVSVDVLGSRTLRVLEPALTLHGIDCLRKLANFANCET